jgi:hypothetical protein
LVVISAFLSMYGYFRSFHRSIISSSKPDYLTGQTGIPAVRD